MTVSGITIHMAAGPRRSKSGRQSIPEGGRAFMRRMAGGMGRSVQSVACSTQDAVSLGYAALISGARALQNSNARLLVMQKRPVSGRSIWRDYLLVQRGRKSPVGRKTLDEGGCNGNLILGNRRNYRACDHFPLCFPVWET